MIGEGANDAADFFFFFLGQRQGAVTVSLLGAHTSRAGKERLASAMSGFLKLERRGDRRSGGSLLAASGFTGSRALCGLRGSSSARKKLAAVVEPDRRQPLGKGAHGRSRRRRSSDCVRACPGLSRRVPLPPPL